MIWYHIIISGVLHDYIIKGLIWTYAIRIYLWLYHTYDIVTMITPVIWFRRLWYLGMCKIISWYHYYHISEYNIVWIMETSKILRVWNMISCIRQLASFNDQFCQVYCLVEMPPSVPSWCAPHQRGEIDGFQGRRERPNQCHHKTIVSGLFNIPNRVNPQMNPQKKNSTIRSIPKPAKPTVHIRHTASWSESCTRHTAKR